MRVESWRWAVVTGALAGATMVSAISSGCVEGTETEELGGSGPEGGSVNTGGEGGEPVEFPCGQDCSLIQTPDCYVSVCNEGMHMGPVGSCVVVPAESGVACDDHVFCTINDTCIAGTCTGGPPNDCGVDPAECQQVVCNEGTQSCSQTPIPNGGACVSPDLCLIGTTCMNGLCSSGTTNDCFFEPVPSDCHVSVCNPMNGMCEPQIGNEGQNCVDQNDLCTVDKTCQNGVCVGGVPKNCDNLTQGCNLGVCEVATGSCIAQAVMNGQLCDDLDDCTLGETCNNQVCDGGTQVTNCSLTGDGCCPGNCDATNDLDCQNPCLPYPHVEGYCWVVALDNLEQHAAACARIGKQPTATQVQGLVWDQQLMTEVTSELGCVNLGVTLCCAESLWYYPGTNECETHNYGQAYWNYGSWDVPNVGVYTCIP